jgi:hypothetical protein
MRERLILDAHVIPPVVPAGVGAIVRISATNRSTHRCSLLALPPSSGRWVQRRPDSPTGGSKPSLTRRVLAACRLAWSRCVAPSHLINWAAPDPGATGTVEVPVPTARRGVFLLPSSRVLVRDPFGLCAVAGPTLPALTVVVHPGSDPDAAWPGGLSGAATLAPFEPGVAGWHDGVGDLVGIRPYVTGDRLSLLHWSASARYGAWFVRQFAPDRGVAVARLVIDDRAGVHRRSDFEKMLSTAQGLIETASRQATSVELVTLSGSSTVLHGDEPRSLDDVRLLLASIRPHRLAGGVAIPEGIVVTTVTGKRTLPQVAARVVIAR